MDNTNSSQHTQRNKFIHRRRQDNSVNQKNRPRMLKNISLHSIANDILTQPNKFQKRINIIVKEYKEVQRRPLDFGLFLKSLAQSKAFLKRLKNEEGASRIPYESLTDAFEAAGMDMNAYENKQHLKYIVGLALQGSAGGGESDKSTDAGKIICGIIGVVCSSDYYIRRDLLYHFCLQR